VVDVLLKEYNVIETVYENLIADLQSAGYNVVTDPMTNYPNSNWGYAARIKAMREHEGIYDLAIELHSNWGFDSSKRGIWVMYCSPEELNPKGYNAALEINKALVAAGYNSITKSEYDNYFVGGRFRVGGTQPGHLHKIPFVLIESGFTSNKNDYASFTNPEYVDKYTDAIVEGLNAYFGL
jgi:N-acetylmuramoyl-L-alanine amidase